MIIEIGDDVLCIKEPDIPNYVGTIWKVVGMQNNIYYCTNYKLNPEEFVFKRDEIVIPSSLIRELL